MSQVVDILIEMGFTKIQAEMAISKCSNPNDVETAMTWILEHNTQEAAAESSAEPTEPPSSSTGETPAKEKEAATAETDVVDANLSSTTESPSVAKSIKCDDCGKLFKSQEDVQYHAAKSGHSNFSESTEEKKPLTDEEKKEQLSKIESKLRQRRLEREEREKTEALDREKTRIRTGKEMLEAKQKHEELEVQRMVQAKKKEKEDDKLARQRVKDQIEQDKLARKAKQAGHDGQENNIQLAPAVVTPTPAASSKPLQPQVSQVHTEVRLQIRLTNGQSLKQTFGAKEPLSAVRLYVEMNRTDGHGAFSLMTAFPKKIFVPEDYDKPLDFLGLAPSSVLVVSKS